VKLKEVLIDQKMHHLNSICKTRCKSYKEPKFFPSGKVEAPVVDHSRDLGVDGEELEVV